MNARAFLPTSSALSPARAACGPTDGPSRLLVLNLPGGVRFYPIFAPMSDDPNDRGLSRKHLMASIDASLKPLMQGHLREMERDLREAGFSEVTAQFRPADTPPELPRPGGPVTPITQARPVCGKSACTRGAAAGLSSSTRLMARVRTSRPSRSRVRR